MYKKYICSLCGWIYDEALGDADSGLAPGTTYENIPDDWECPSCGVSKDMLEPYS
ncbi:MAG: rubredoxin [Vampirovibrionales bacterium]|jgi:rubredoxin-NAD+ reductase